MSTFLTLESSHTMLYFQLAKLTCKFKFDYSSVFLIVDHFELTICQLNIIFHQYDYSWTFLNRASFHVISIFSFYIKPKVSNVCLHTSIEFAGLVKTTLQKYSELSYADITLIRTFL